MDDNTVTALVTISIIFWGYFLPTIIAMKRDHQSTGSITVINLFFGWTLLGWVLCLAWSLSSTRPIVVLPTRYLREGE